MELYSKNLPWLSISLWSWRRIIGRNCFFYPPAKAAEWIARDSREILRPASENRDACLSLETILVSWLQLFGALPPHHTELYSKNLPWLSISLWSWRRIIGRNCFFYPPAKAAEWIARDSREILRPATENRDMIYIYIYM